MWAESGHPSLSSCFRFHVRIVSSQSRTAWVPHSCPPGRQLGRGVPYITSHLYSVSAVFLGVWCFVERDREEEGF